MKKFNVLLWSFNHDKLTYYDVLPYLRNCYKERVKKSKKKHIQRSEEVSKFWKVPETLDEFKEFIKCESQYQYWSRCEYEMILHGWPNQKNTYKLDVHEQIMMNIDVVAEILYNEFKKRYKRKKVKFKGGQPLTCAPQLSEERLRETMIKPEDIRAIIDSGMCEDNSKLEFELKQLIYKLEE